MRQVLYRREVCELIARSSSYVTRHVERLGGIRKGPRDVYFPVAGFCAATGIPEEKVREAMRS